MPAQVSELLSVGPFYGIDASTSKYWLDPMHGADSIGVVPDRAFQGYVTAKGRTHAFAQNYASALFGFTEFQRAGVPEIYVAAANSGGNGVLQYAQAGGNVSTLSLPVVLSQSLETSFRQYQQWLFVCNSTDPPLKIDTNLNVTRWGVAAPTQAPSITTQGTPSNGPTLSLIAGTSNGVKVYAAITIVAGGVESNASPVTNITPSGAQQAQVAAPGGITGTFYNVYVGASPSLLYKQNASPIAVTSTYTIPGTPTTTGSAPPVVSYGLIGQYFYLVTFGDSFQESSASPVSLVSPNFAGTSFPVLTGVPVSTDPQVTFRNIYRFGGTMQEILLVGTLNDNTTTVFGDNTPDLSVSGAALVQHRDPPQPFYDIEAHKGRIWGFGYNGTAVGEPASIQGTSDLWYSNYEEPWGFNNVTQVIPIGRNSGGDIAVVCKSLGSILCCLKARSFWVVIGDTQQDFIQRRLAHIGCASKKSAAVGYDRLFWLSPEGAVYMFDGEAFTNISDNRQTQANSSIKTILDGFTATDFQQAAGAIYDGTYLISFPSQGITFMYDIATGQWYKLPWAFDRAISDPNDHNEIIASEPGTGIADNWFAAETDLGASITSSFVSRIADSGVPAATKRYRYLTLLAPVQSGASATVTLTTDPGGNQQQVTSTVNLGTGPPSHRLSLPPSMLGSEVQLTLAVTSTARTEIHRAVVHGWVERQFTPQG